ncbi:hypothetical protein BDP55DRAFT_642283 [Colletotrichum godetiae]|uniref:Uncharacterized protein n=1 Tax=Colletotrichum godetiae TaxID=1209918 RepID=A0AAJ0F4A7_9PEZI|nr:uncharacterized protein BDP55DRAFT_642283 [Colletotrichum godetiae]KAK1700260.1 hypothetical protein BDP55DRAFT_642283 [Colletotrichum godetiae]
MAMIRAAAVAAAAAPAAQESPPPPRGSATFVIGPPGRKPPPGDAGACQRRTTGEEVDPEGRVSADTISVGSASKSFPTPRKPSPTYAAQEILSEQAREKEVTKLRSSAHSHNLRSTCVVDDEPSASANRVNETGSGSLGPGFRPRLQVSRDKPNIYGAPSIDPFFLSHSL